MLYKRIGLNGKVLDSKGFQIAKYGLEKQTDTLLRQISSELPIRFTEIKPKQKQKQYK